MIIELQDKVAKYMTQNADLASWKSIREYYAYYTYLAFLCFVAKALDPDCRSDNVSEIIKKSAIVDDAVLHFVLSVRHAEKYIKEILDLANMDMTMNIDYIYQEYLARDYVLSGTSIIFEGGKNHRDILGSYYTQEGFAYEITKKAIQDFCLQRYQADQPIRIADYSCGGGAFLISACRLCREKGIPLEIYGYDVDPVAVLITHFRLYNECGNSQGKLYISLGNPLMRGKKKVDVLDQFKMAASGKFYNSDMAIMVEGDMDIVVGNPPWEKIRFEEKKFLHHFALYENISTKAAREEYLRSMEKDNKEYYDDFIRDYEKVKTRIKRDAFFKQSSCGELNTYALFVELCLNNLSEGSIAGLIIKSSFVKMPVYSRFFKKITSEKILYKLYMFVNRKKIFNIDSREEFSVIFFQKGNKADFSLALDLDEYKGFTKKESIECSYELLNTLNPNTGMIPRINSKIELEFLMDVYKRNRIFGEVYPQCRFGRLVHLTNHSESIINCAQKNYIPIYEGKFIEIYTAKYATFKGMSKRERYKNKATARPIENIEGDEYPQARFFIRDDVWRNLSKKFNDGYVVAWRSLTSATNRRTMLSTMLPLVPACQSIQILQLSRKEEMLHILAVFNSIIFDYIVRLKMAGLDLTQTIIKQIPVPEEESFCEIINFMEKNASIETHINSRIKKLYQSDIRMERLFDDIELYDIDDGKTRKEIITEIDQLVAVLYRLDRESLRNLAFTFKKYYSRKEVEMLF